MRGTLKNIPKHNLWPVKTANTLCTSSKRLVWWNIIHTSKISVVLLALKVKGQKYWMPLVPETASASVFSLSVMYLTEYLQLYFVHLYSWSKARKPYSECDICKFSKSIGEAYTQYGISHTKHYKSSRRLSLHVAWWRGDDKERINEKGKRDEIVTPIIVDLRLLFNSVYTTKDVMFEPFPCR